MWRRRCWTRSGSTGSPWSGSRPAGRPRIQFAPVTRSARGRCPAVRDLPPNAFLGRPAEQRPRLPGDDPQVPGPGVLPDPPGDETHAEAGLRGFVRTETTYDMSSGKRAHRADPRRPDPASSGDGDGGRDGARAPEVRRGDQRPVGPAAPRRASPGSRSPRPPLSSAAGTTATSATSNSTHAAQGIPDAELMTVDQFGHLIWWGDPSVRANLHLRIEAFLSEHAAA